MKKSTESLTATLTEVKQSPIQLAHHYTSCFGNQRFIRLSGDYAKEGGENGVRNDLA